MLLQLTFLSILSILFSSCSSSYAQVYASPGIEETAYFSVSCLFKYTCPNYPFYCNRWEICPQVAHRLCTRNEINSASEAICKCQNNYCPYVVKGSSGTTCCHPLAHEICTLQEWSSTGKCFSGGHSCKPGYEGRFGGHNNNGCFCCKKEWYKACSEASWVDYWYRQTGQYHKLCPNGYTQETINGLSKCWKDTRIEQKTCSYEEWNYKQPCPDSVCQNGYSCRQLNSAVSPVCCQNNPVILATTTTGPLGVCPHSGIPAKQLCRTDKDCGNCRYTCQNSLCCDRVGKYINGTVAVPTGTCDSNVACKGLCVDQLCYPADTKSLHGFWDSETCPNGQTSKIFCPGSCCPNGMTCINKVCCKE